MAVVLEIEDGDPWYLSPNVWTVPGTDPSGPPGVPVAGKSCFLWAHVLNGGQDPVTDAVVRFYWANPSVGFDRTTANLIGTSFVTLEAGASADVLSLTPWVPAYVNQGHECVLAEAFHPTLDPLPGTAAFDVPTDRHVAQRNIAVASGSQFSYPFEVHNRSRVSRSFNLGVRVGKLGEVEKLLPLLGRSTGEVQKSGRVGRLGFVHSPSVDAATLKAAVPKIERMVVGPHERVGCTLVGETLGGAALVHVVQQEGERIIGGLAVLVLGSKGERQ